MPDFDIVPARLAVKAMRDNGYKNPAYAICELIDNAIQAKATDVQLLCVEEKVTLNGRNYSRLKNIAILDNGEGMDSKTLRASLQFGNGKYLDYDKHTGIGRFGMGLPCSSISQAQKVEVWTWQKQTKDPLYSYLDVEEINNGLLTEVPNPSTKAVPKLWKSVGDFSNKSGTLVVWSGLDRCIWKTSQSIFENSEFLIGRIYRHFIMKKKVSIRMISYDLADLKKPKLSITAMPNDPMYLMEKTSCPSPFDKSPMFDFINEHEFVVDYRNKLHSVKLRFSLARKEARAGGSPGDAPHGKHADKNKGVSIVRADRELDLDTRWTIGYDPRERWWGAEIIFPPGLDDIFGVTNNKQAANHFSELAKIEIDDLLKDGKTIHQLKDEWNDCGDPRAPLLEIAQTLQKNIRILRSNVKEQTRGKKKKRYDQSHVEAKATEATQERKVEGHVGLSDKFEDRPKEERIKELSEDLISEGTELQEAVERAASIIENNLKYEILEANIESPAFFSVRQVAGILKVTLNTSHPAYDNLVEILEEDVDGASNETLRERLKNALDGLKLLLTAWARYEDEQPDGVRREKTQEARTDWGRVARTFLRDRR
jgi:hypothetical protein